MAANTRHAISPAHQAPKLLNDTGYNFDVGMMLLNCLAAFALNLAVFLLIGKTSALTMNIAGVVKDWMLIGLSVLIFGCDPASPAQPSPR